MVALPSILTQPNLRLRVASGDELDVRYFTVREQISSLFSVQILAVSHNADIDFESVITRPASFAAMRGPAFEPRRWSGVVSQIEQLEVEDSTHGLSTYQLTLVPELWLLTQRRNHRMFQQRSEPKIVLDLLADWGIRPELALDVAKYKDRKYRVQYGETDFAFMSRMLEDAGISFYFADKDGQTKLVLSDAPEKKALKTTLPYVNRTTGIAAADYVTDVQLTRQVRPGRYTQRDHDYRKAPSFPLLASAQADEDIESGLERFHYTPGAFLWRADAGETTPSADDKGKHRTDLDEGQAQVQKRLEAQRASARMVVFRTPAIDLQPGDVMSIVGHPRSDLGPQKPLLVVSSTFTGDFKGDWSHVCESRFADMPFRPLLVTPKPKVQGVESATVVGPAGEEIHTDEFGRVRVHFHWDRESQMNDKSSCWIHTSQPWGGAGYGGINLPRVGQEVIVDFLGGDPDRPIVIGRMYTNLQKVPYGLPANKTQSGWRSNSSPGGGGFNELMFEDKKGGELVRFQAEKDFSGLVKNDAGMVIGHDSLHQVGNDETRTVMHDQTLKIGHDRKIRVQNDQAHVIDKNLIQQTVSGATTVLSKLGITQASETEIVLRVGTSAIVMKPNEIKIQADMVYINPGNVTLPAPPQPPVIDGVKAQTGHFFGAP